MQAMNCVSVHTKLSLKLVCLRVCKGNSFDLPKARKTAAMNSAREVSMLKEGRRVCARTAANVVDEITSTQLEFAFLTLRNFFFGGEGDFWWGCRGRYKIFHFPI